MTENNNVQQLLSTVTKSIDEDFSDFEPLKKASELFNVKPSTIVLPVIGVVLVFSLLTTVIAKFVIVIIGMIYPSYMSFKAINVKSEELCKKWLTYWVVFAFLTVFDGLLSTLLFFLPAYYSFKVLFIIWLFYPRTDGASKIYEKVLRPNLQKIKSQIKGFSTAK